MIRCLLLLFTVILSFGVFAQHCPYDGMYLVAIKITDKEGKMLADVKPVFYLQEVDNPKVDSCTSAAGLVKKLFLSSDAFAAVNNNRFNRNGYNAALNNRLKDAGVFANANMMLSLNQSENTCTLIGKSETVYAHYIYRQRKFVIVYTVNGKEIMTPLPDGFTSALCTNNRDLKNFKTVAIKL
jgi:hypothetical protein